MRGKDTFLFRMEQFVALIKHNPYLLVLLVRIYYYRSAGLKSQQILLESLN